MKRESEEEIEKMLFTTSKPDELVHRSVVAFDAKHAVSFRHGQHSLLEKDAKVILYNVVDSDLQYEAVVFEVADRHDIIIFKLTVGEFKTYPHATNSPYRGKAYLQVGVNPHRQPFWKEGTITEETSLRYVGTSHGKFGDSGTGIFDSSRRFLGLSIGKAFASNDSEEMPIEEVANHYSDTLIIGVEIIQCIACIDDPDSELYSPT